MTSADAYGMVAMPHTRRRVVEALEPLADSVYQERWRSSPTTLFDIRNSLNTFDDDFLLDAPAGAVDGVLEANEVEPFEDLAEVLIPIMEDLRPPRGEGFLAQVPDAVWLTHPLWPEVVTRAARLLSLMRTNGVLGPDDPYP